MAIDFDTTPFFDDFAIFINNKGTSLNASDLFTIHIFHLNNVKYIFCDKDKLARYNSENIILQNLKIDEDIFILNETGHFPYFEDPAQLEEVLIKILSNN